MRIKYLNSHDENQGGTATQQVANPPDSQVESQVETPPEAPVETSEPRLPRKFQTNHELMAERIKQLYPQEEEGEENAEDQPEPEKQNAPPPEPEPVPAQGINDDKESYVAQAYELEKVLKSHGLSDETIRRTIAERLGVVIDPTPAQPGVENSDPTQKLAKEFGIPVPEIPEEPAPLNMEEESKILRQQIIEKYNQRFKPVVDYDENGEEVTRPAFDPDSDPTHSALLETEVKLALSDKQKEYFDKKAEWERKSGEAKSNFEEQVGNAAFRREVTKKIDENLGHLFNEGYKVGDKTTADFLRNPDGTVDKELQKAFGGLANALYDSPVVLEPLFARNDASEIFQKPELTAGHVTHAVYQALTPLIQIIERMKKTTTEVKPSAPAQLQSAEVKPATPQENQQPPKAWHNNGLAVQNTTVSGTQEQPAPREALNQPKPRNLKEAVSQVHKRHESQWAEQERVI